MRRASRGSDIRNDEAIGAECSRNWTWLEHEKFKNECVAHCCCLGLLVAGVAIEACSLGCQVLLLAITHLRNYRSPSASHRMFAHWFRDPNSRTRAFSTRRALQQQDLPRDRGPPDQLHWRTSGFGYDEPAMRHADQRFRPSFIGAPYILLMSQLQRAIGIGCSLPA